MKKVKPRVYRKWTIAEKRKVINEYNTTDINIRDLCLKFGIYPAQFYQWKTHIDKAVYKIKTSPIKLSVILNDNDPLVLRIDYLMAELKLAVTELSKKRKSQ